jgi:hypothetical protein
MQTKTERGFAGNWVCMGLIGVFCLGFALSARGAPPTLSIQAPMSPPAWALLERELLKANAEACQEFFTRYFDERGWLLCVERWGGDDGLDDAIENCNDWPLLSALGAADVVRQLTRRAWEGHLRQSTLARTTEVPFARDGIYYKEFPVMFDWRHNGEGLNVFNLMGLNDPDDGRLQQRIRRYAGFYLGEDPGADCTAWEGEMPKIAPGQLGSGFDLPMPNWDWCPHNPGRMNGLLAI